MDEQTKAYIKKLVDEAPPLTQEQRDKIAALLKPSSWVALPDDPYAERTIVKPPKKGHAREV